MMGKYFCNRFEVRMHHLSKVVGVTAITLALTTLSGCQTLKNSKLLGGKDEVVATKAEKSEQGYYQAASDLPLGRCGCPSAKRGCLPVSWECILRSKSRYFLDYFEYWRGADRSFHHPDGICGLVLRGHLDRPCHP